MIEQEIEMITGRLRIAIGILAIFVSSVAIVVVVLYQGVNFEVLADLLFSIMFLMLGFLLVIITPYKLVIVNKIFKFWFIYGQRDIDVGRIVEMKKVLPTMSVPGRSFVNVLLFFENSSFPFNRIFFAIKAEGSDFRGKYYRTELDGYLD